MAVFVASDNAVYGLARVPFDVQFQALLDEAHAHGCSGALLFRIVHPVLESVRLPADQPSGD